MPEQNRRVLLADLPHHAGQVVRVAGWLHRRRDLAAVTFLVLRDRSGIGQVVVKDAPTLTALDGIGEESVLEVEGTLTENASAPGGVEITEPVVRLFGEPAQTPPVELWRPTLNASLPVHLDNAALTWRHPAQRARWELAAASLRGFREAMDSLGFTEIHTPKFVSSATESGANVFEVDYFGRPAYLAQSPQFYKQQMVGVFERVYEVGPVFRAEPHDTARHLAEYVSLDVELGFIQNHRDVIAVLADVVRGMVDGITTWAPRAASDLGLGLPRVPDEIPIVHFSEALRIAGAPDDEPDLAPAHERAVSAWALETYGSELVAVEGYPMVKRPFYTHPQPDDARWSNSFDLIFRGLELVTGGQRLHRYADYVAAIEQRSEDASTYRDYLAPFRHGMPPHGGFALGLERWTARLIGAENVREVTLFPRDINRLTP